MLIKSFAAAVALFAATAAVIPATQDAKAAERSTKAFEIDGTHSSVVFRVKHLGASMFYGRFNKVGGKFQVDDDKLSDSYVKVEIPAASLDSNNAGRDRHLSGPDFFNVKEYPKIMFESSSVEKTEEGYLIKGDLTMRGKKKAVEAHARHIGTKNMNPRFGLRSGYEARLVIKRSDFGMNWGVKNGVIGDEVTIWLGIEGKLPG